MSTGEAGRREHRDSGAVVLDHRRPRGKVKRGTGSTAIPTPYFWPSASPLRRAPSDVPLTGVANVARPNGHPTPVREEELESVRLLVQGVNETGVLPAPEDPLEPGQVVVVTDGPFSGMVGVLLETRSEVRVAVRLEALYQAVSVALGRDAVRPLARDAPKAARPPFRSDL